MAFIGKDLRARANVERLTRRSTYPKLILENNQGMDKKYDIFLSHRGLDAQLVLGIAIRLREKHGYSVYIDWIEDGELDRANVAKKTAEVLRHRLNSSKSLMFVHTENSTESKWMPWELGYMDGSKPRKCTILPVKALKEGEINYKKQEYLNLYPEAIEEGTYPPKLYVLEDGGKVKFKIWLHRKNEKKNKQILFD